LTLAVLKNVFIALLDMQGRRKALLRTESKEQENHLMKVIQS
jgi:hypothetical protein